MRSKYRKTFDTATRIARFVFGPRKRPAVRPPQIVTHTNCITHLASEFNRPGMKILELGSRVVTGAVCRHSFPNAAYVGFDLFPGPNVDVVGDAHQLTSYFGEGEKFDLIISIAVFEHLYMPWVVGRELRKTFESWRLRLCRNTFFLHRAR